MNNIIEKLRSILKASSDENVRISGERFFREEVRLYGIKSAMVEQIGKEHYSLIKGLPKKEIFDLCGELWRSGMMEESFIACHWSYYVRKEYEPEDFIWFDRWVKNHVTNWASCDTLCNHSVGTLVEMYPELTDKLKEWAGSPNRWARRAAAVSLIIPARKGKFREEIFQIADILLTDSDDMVRKGYGWMLKAASQAGQDEVFSYVMRNKSVMPRTSLRYAIEKMTPELKKKAMAK